MPAPFPEYSAGHVYALLTVGIGNAMAIGHAVDYARWSFRQPFEYVYRMLTPTEGYGGICSLRHGMAVCYYASNIECFYQVECSIERRQ